MTLRNNIYIIVFVHNSLRGNELILLDVEISDAPLCFNRKDCTSKNITKNEVDDFLCSSKLQVSYEK